jgi:hypothetical protein
MNYFEYLKRRFPFYIISGIILCVMIFLLIAGKRHNSYLIDTLDSMKSISARKAEVKRYSGEINSLEVYFRDNFEMDLTGRNPEKFLFQAADDLRTYLRDATVTVKTYQIKKGKKELPVEIRAGMKNYRMIIEYVDYIESFRMPDYRINDISVLTDPSGKVILNIKGVFVMPSSGGSA